MSRSGITRTLCESKTVVLWHTPDVGDAITVKFLDSTRSDRRLQWESIIDVTNFGADPTGATDSTTAINSAIAATPLGGTTYFPNGTYLTDGVTPSAGTTLLGQSRVGTTLKLRTAQAALLTMQAKDVIVQQLTFDGNLLPTTSVVKLAAGAGRCMFEYVNVKKATAGTSDLIQVPWDGVSTTRIDEIDFFHCTIQQDPSSLATYAREGIYQPNPYSRLFFDRCYIANAANLWAVGHGTTEGATCNIRDCTVGAAQTAIFNVQGLAGACTLEHIETDVTQGANVYLLTMATSSATGNRTVTLKNCVYSVASGQVVAVSCQQPVVLDGNTFGGGDVNISPTATYGTRTTRANGNTFTTAGKGFVGSFGQLLSQQDNWTT